MIADNQLFMNFDITRRRSRVIKVHKTPSEGELSLKIIEKVWGLICFYAILSLGECLVTFNSHTKFDCRGR